MPFEVPITIEVDTAIHVGDPKLRLPASENVWTFILLSPVHRTTSHGGDGVSVSALSSCILLVKETFRLCAPKNAGDDGRGDKLEDEGILDWKRRSKGRKEGVGLFKPGRDATDGRRLLPGDDSTEP